METNTRVYVKRHEVMAARLSIRIKFQLGKPIPEALWKIAGAKSG